MTGSCLRQSNEPGPTRAGVAAWELPRDPFS